MLVPLLLNAFLLVCSVHFTSQGTLEAALKSRGCTLIRADICDMAGGGVTSKCLLYNKTVRGPI